MCFPVQSLASTIISYGDSSIAQRDMSEGGGEAEGEAEEEGESERERGGEAEGEGESDGEG